MKKNILKVLKEFEVIQSGHFLLPSGKHSDRYIQFANLLKYPDKAMELLNIAAEDINNSGLTFDTVLGPAVGGITVAYELARQLKKPIIYTERVDGAMAIPEVFEIKKGQKILIAEDVITSGNTAREVVALVECFGARVVGIACIVNKENISMKQRIYSCISLNLKSYEAENCMLCKEKLPLKPAK